MPEKKSKTKKNDSTSEGGAERMPDQTEHAGKTAKPKKSKKG